MGPPPDTPIPVATIETLLFYTYVDKAVQGLLYGALALLIWDHILTFPREVEYVWKGRWTVIKALFLFNRYVTLVVVTGNAWILTGTVQGLTNNFCKHWILICSAIELLCISFVSFVILFRLHAVWGGSRKTFLALLFAWFVSFAGATIIFFTVFYGSRHWIYHEERFNICFAVVPRLWLQWLPDALLHALLLGIILWKAIATPRSSQTPMLGLLYREGIVYYSTTLVILVAGILIWRFANLAWVGGPLYVGWVLCQIAMSRLLLSLRSVSAFSARVTKVATKTRPQIRLRVVSSDVDMKNYHHHHTRQYSMTHVDNHKNYDHGYGYPLETFYRSGTVMSTRSTTTNVSMSPSNEDGATLVHHDTYRDGKESPDGGKERESTRTYSRLLSPLGSSPRYERQGRSFVRQDRSNSEPQSEPVYPSLSPGGRRREGGIDEAYVYGYYPDHVGRIVSRAELEEDLTRARTRVGNFESPLPPRQRLTHLLWWLIGRGVEADEEVGGCGCGDGTAEEDVNALGRRRSRRKTTRRGLVTVGVRDARVCVDAAEVERWDPEDDRGPGVKDSRLGRYDHWL